VSIKTLTSTHSGHHIAGLPLVGTTLAVLKTDRADAQAGWSVVLDMDLRGFDELAWHQSPLYRWRLPKNLGRFTRVISSRRLLCFGPRSAADDLGCR
jgi:hypothetical protein